MLTWALCWLLKGTEARIGAGFMLMVMMCDVIIFVSITAIWWGKYIK